MSPTMKSLPSPPSIRSSPRPPSDVVVAESPNPIVAAEAGAHVWAARRSNHVVALGPTIVAGISVGGWVAIVREPDTSQPPAQPPRCDGRERKRNQNGYEPTIAGMNPSS